MAVSLTADTLTVAATQGLGFVNSIVHSSNLSFSSDLGVPAIFVQSSAVFFDGIAPPTVRCSSVRTIRRTLHRKKRRTRRKTYSGDESDDGGDAGEELEFFGGGDGGPIGGGGGSWGGGGGWNFHRFGGQNWDDSSWFLYSDFAYGFVYEVLYWIALSTCLHFAFAKVMRIMGGGIVDDNREKGSMRLASVC